MRFYYKSCYSYFYDLSSITAQWLLICRQAVSISLFFFNATIYTCFPLFDNYRQPHLFYMKTVYIYFYMKTVSVTSFYLEVNFVSATGGTVMFKTDSKHYDESPVLIT